jgi:hypothetical protein
MSKVCSGCKGTKELTEFWKRSSRKHGYVSRCKDCGNKAQSILQKTEVVRLQNRKDKLWRNFGLTLEGYEKLFEGQERVCAICKEPEKTFSNNGFPKHLAVDHCHTTGKVRGLLCHHCNAGIGNLKDNIELLKEAITYLSRYEGEKL